MTVLRQEFQISVEGADAAAAALGRTAAAMNGVNEAAIRDRIAIADAEAAIVKKIRAEQAHALMLKQNAELVVTNTKNMTAFGRAANVAGGALTSLRKLAEILPGFELGTIFAAIAAGAYGLYKVFQDTTSATGMMTDAMIEYGKTVDKVIAESVRKFDSLRVAQTQAGLALVGGALGVKGEQLPFNQAMSARGLQAQLESAREAQKKAMEGTAELERRKAALEFDRAKYGKLLPTDPVAIEFRRRQIEINEQRRGYEATYNQAASDLRRLSAPYESTGRTGRAAKKVAAPFDPLAPLGDRALPDLRAQNTSDLLKKAGEWMNAPGMSGTNLPGARGAGVDAAAETSRAADEQARAVLNLASAWDYLGASMGGTVGRMAQSASDIGSIVTQSVGALTGALGAAATNMIIAGDAGGKALKKQAGNALAGISAQAFGYATLLTAFGIAAAIPGVGTIMGLAAPGFFAAAGVMAGAGAALGVGARMLGADKIGAGSGAGNAASAGASAPVGAGSSGPGMAGQTTPLELHVYMGGDEVHDLTYRTARRREMSGSMSMPRVGVAA